MSDIEEFFKTVFRPVGLVKHFSYTLGFFHPLPSLGEYTRNSLTKDDLLWFGLTSSIPCDLDEFPATMEAWYEYFGSFGPSESMIISAMFKFGMVVNDCISIRCLKLKFEAWGEQQNERNGLEEKPTQDECVVCYKSVNSVTKCGHYLCRECHKKIENNKCPLCRQVIKFKCRQDMTLFS